VPKGLNLQEIVSEFYSSVYRFALTLTRNEIDASDLTQQTFFLLSRHADQIRDTTKIRAWLFTTLRREFFRIIRRRAEHPEVEFKTDEHDPPTMDSAAMRSIDAQSVLQAFEKIDPNYRDALELFYLGELSYKEIADQLQIPLGTVMSRLARGKAQLKAVLADAGELEQERIAQLPKKRSEQQF
jgi:RNA polymerase sigma-70 factor, ECF subfamily